MAETINQPLVNSQRNLINPLTGFFSKAVDTVLEIALVREGAKQGSKRAIGTIAPTGQLDPARVQSVENTASKEETPNEVASDAKNHIPIFLGIGGIVLVGVFLMTRKRGK